MVSRIRSGGRGTGDGRARAAAGGREGHYKPFLTETLWRKGNRTVVFWAFMREEGKAPAFDSLKAMSMVTGGFIIEGEGAQ